MRAGRAPAGPRTPRSDRPSPAVGPVLLKPGNVAAPVVSDRIVAPWPPACSSLEADILRVEPVGELQKLGQVVFCNASRLYTHARNLNAADRDLVVGFRFLTLRERERRVGGRAPHLDQVGPRADRYVALDDFARHLGEDILAGQEYLPGQTLFAERAERAEREPVLVGDHRLKVVLGQGQRVFDLM